jgi:hypothetical protein
VESNGGSTRTRDPTAIAAESLAVAPIAGLGIGEPPRVTL